MWGRALRFIYSRFHRDADKRQPASKLLHPEAHVDFYIWTAEFSFRVLSWTNSMNKNRRTSLPVQQLTSSAHSSSSSERHTAAGRSAGPPSLLPTNLSPPTLFSSCASEPPPPLSSLMCFLKNQTQRKLPSLRYTLTHTCTHTHTQNQHTLCVCVSDLKNRDTHTHSHTNTPAHTHTYTVQLVSGCHNLHSCVDLTPMAVPWSTCSL